MGRPEQVLHRLRRGASTDTRARLAVRAARSRLLARCLRADDDWSGPPSDRPAPARGESETAWLSDVAWRPLGRPRLCGRRRRGRPGRDLEQADTYSQERRHIRRTSPSPDPAARVAYRDDDRDDTEQPAVERQRVERLAGRAWVGDRTRRERLQRRARMFRQPLELDARLQRLSLEPERRPHQDMRRRHSRRCADDELRAGRERQVELPGRRDGSGLQLRARAKLPVFVPDGRVRDDRLHDLHGPGRQLTALSALALLSLSRPWDRAHREQPSRLGGSLLDRVQAVAERNAPARHAPPMP